MKRKKLFDAMGMIDDTYIEEASARRTRRGKRAIIRITAIAACFALLLTGLNLWLFLPLQSDLPDVSQYADSEYYDIIQKLNVLTYRAPRYKNNFQRLSRSLYKLAPGANAEDAGSSIDMTLAGVATNGTYYETTDNQVSGVIEADLIKRSDRYIYYMDDATLRVFEIKGEDSAEVGSYEIPHPDGVLYDHLYPLEFYLSADCRTVTYLYSYTSKDVGTCVRVVTLDVSDPQAISEKRSVGISGDYLSSRLVDGKLLLVCNFYVGYDPDFSDERTFIPQIDDGNGAVSIPFDRIISPDVLTAPRYTVVCKLDAETLAAEGANAFLSYSTQLYVSRDHVFATHGYYAKTTEGNVVTSRAMTEISCLAYSEGTLAYKGSFKVIGEVKDQYSLDEHEGVLRVVTTTRVNKYEENKTSDTVSFVGSNEINAALTCVRLSDFHTVALVENFAPAGESVQSARFDGDAAYVCTSVVLSDPVFFFDLSDLANITYKDTGTIEGFSSSLVNFGDGFLLGIGVGNSFDTVKIEVYEETETGVASVCKHEVTRAAYSANYKSYLIDRENGFVGLGITLREGGEDASRYVLLHFDCYNLNVLADIPLAGDNYAKRAVVIDGYLYAFGENDFSVTKVLN